MLRFDNVVLNECYYYLMGDLRPGSVNIVKRSFVIFDIRALWRSFAHPWTSECPDVKNYKRQLNPVWHRMFDSCTHMATLGVKGSTSFSYCNPRSNVTKNAYCRL